VIFCRAPLHKGCPKHRGHKGDPGVTPVCCGASGEKAQVIIVWVRAPSIGNASHPRGLGVMREGHEPCVAHSVRILECLRTPHLEV
jgi:hypothetical protein